MDFGIAGMNFGLGDMNSWCRLGAPLAPVKVGCGKGWPVKIITDSVETVVSGKTDIPHPSNYTVPQQSVAYIYTPWL